MGRNTNFDIDGYLTRLAPTVATRMTAAMLAVETSAKKSINRGNVSGSNPSAEGEPPKKVTGTLQTSVGHHVSTSGLFVDGYVGIRSGPAIPYARRLELGFFGRDAAGRSVSQGPRPFLRPSVFDNASLILRTLTK